MRTEEIGDQGSGVRGRPDLYDSIEGQIDRFMAVAENVLFYAAIAGVILLIIVQTVQAV